VQEIRLGAIAKSTFRIKAFGLQFFQVLPSRKVNPFCDVKRQPRIYLGFRCLATQSIAILLRVKWLDQSAPATSTVRAVAHKTSSRSHHNSGALFTMNAVVVASVVLTWQLPKNM
jgi:hypothetical protein